ncbi:MAG: hypothetical protein HQK79_11290 [Desulfobacterales bacterium]|nr:hypothetical protein [Desulfobacterales bacterium]
MLNENNEFDLKKVGLFIGLVLGTAIITTILYWLIYGFDKWKTDITSASNLMLAANVYPSLQGHTSQSGGGTAGQYLCPTHGAVGMPVINVQGVPACPICGMVMQFNGYTANNNNLAPAAFGGG